MLVLYTIIFAYSLFSFCDAAYVDTLPRCSIKDNECLKSLHQKLLNDITKNGIPEFNLSPHDSLEISNITITILDTIIVRLGNAVAKGIGTCKVNNYSLNLDKLIAFKGVTCDVTIEGDAKISGKSDALQSAVGLSSMIGETYGKVEIDQLKLNYEIPIKIFKKHDGETYLEDQTKAIKYTYDIGNAKFSTKNLVLGGTDVAEMLLPYANENWRMFMKFIGPKFFDIGTEAIVNSANFFFTRIPLKKYIIEDLSSYAE